MKNKLKNYKKYCAYAIFVLSFPTEIFAQLDSIYYDSGELKAFGELQNNAKHGHWKYFYPNGEINAIEKYQDGKLNGEIINYYPNGQISSEENWVHGELEG